MFYFKNLLFNLKNKGKIKIGKSLYFINNGIFTGEGSSVGAINNGTTKLLNPKEGSLIINGKFSLGKNTRIHKGCCIQVDGDMAVGSNTYINPNCIIVCKHHISIGSDCAIAWNVTIMDDNLHHTESKKRSAINIGNKVWIGSGSSIFKGVNIADGTVIAANSIVGGDTEPNSLYAGNPAKLIKNNFKWQM